MVTINSAREDLIGWFVPDPKSKGLYIIRLIGGVIILLIGLYLLTINIIGTLIAFIFGIIVIYFN